MDMEFYWTLGNNVRSYRMQRGMTQEALAEKAQISAKGLQKVEAGKSGMRMDTFVQIARALMVSMDVLAGKRGTDEVRRNRQEAFCSMAEDRTDEEIEFAMELVRMVFCLQERYPDRFSGRNGNKSEV